MARNILSVVAGLAAAVIIFMIAEFLGSLIYPFPIDMDINDEARMARYVADIPIEGKLLILFGWALGSTVAGYLIKLISRGDSRLPPLVAGVLLTLAGISNFFMVPHPVWFIVAGILCFVPFVLLGYNLRKTNATEEEL